MAEFTYEIKEDIAVLSEAKSGYTKELKLISYGGRDPKYDIRDWAPVDEEGKRKMAKGTTLTKEEVIALRDALNQLDLS